MNRSSHISLPTCPNLHARIRTQFPRPRRTLPHRACRLNRPSTSTHFRIFGRSLLPLILETMGRAWAMSMAIDGQNHSPERKQAPSKGRLTCGYAWSGRRDSNPRPSPWQKKVMRSVHTVHELRLCCAAVHVLSTKYAPVQAVRRALYVRALTIENEAESRLKDRSMSHRSNGLVRSAEGSPPTQRGRFSPVLRGGPQYDHSTLSVRPGRLNCDRTVQQSLLGRLTSVYRC